MIKRRGQGKKTKEGEEWKGFCISFQNIVNELHLEETLQKKRTQILLAGVDFSRIHLHLVGKRSLELSNEEGRRRPLRKRKWLGKSKKGKDKAERITRRKTKGRTGLRERLQ